MTLTTNLKLMQKAQKHKYAIGAFNINNLEFLQSIIQAAEKEKSPVIIQTTEGAIDYAGLNYLRSLVITAAEETKIPLTLHLDHGKDLNTIKQCINSGYTSIMIDGSHLPLRKNIAITRKVVKLAHKKGISVEAELGTIGGVEDKVSSRNIIYTDPGTARFFVDATGTDVLAVAIGTSHGAYKFKGKSDLKIDILKEIKKTVNIPLVLHGASGIPQQIVAKANKYGAKLTHAHGVDNLQIKKAIQKGICKINIDSDLRLSFTAALRETLRKHPTEFDPRKILNPSKQLITDTVRKKIQLFGSSNKA